MTVSDTGEGLTEEACRRVFEPFYTTKKLGQGTGLGLAVVYGIVRQLHGYIYVRSVREQGTSFDVYWPRLSEDYEQHAPIHSQRVPAARRMNVLVVEDNDDVRTIVEALLRSIGHEVLAYAEPHAALAAIRSVSRPVDLLMTDVVMTGMNGKELAEQVLRVLPDIPVVFMSGYSDEVLSHRGVLEPDVTLLRKPFSAEELEAALRSALERSSVVGQKGAQRGA